MASRRLSLEGQQLLLPGASSLVSRTATAARPPFHYWGSMEGWPLRRATASAVIATLQLCGQREETRSPPAASSFSEGKGDKHRAGWLGHLGASRDT